MAGQMAKPQFPGPIGKAARNNEI